MNPSIGILLIDTGAQCKVIPVESLEENISPKPDLLPVNFKLFVYND